MNKFRILFAGILAAVFLCGCGNKEKFADLMKNAEQNAISGKWEKALEYSKKAQKRNPKSYEAVLLTTLAYEQQGKINEALVEIHKAAKLAPKNYFCLYTFGRILYRFKRNDDAINALKEAIKINPGCTDARVLLTRIATEQKDYQTAALQLRALLQDKAFQNKALVYNEIGTYFVLIQKNNKTGLAWCSAASKRDESNPIYALNTAILQDRNGNFSGARTTYQKYLELTKHNPALAANRAAVEARLRQIQAR